MGKSKVDPRGIQEGLSTCGETFEKSTDLYHHHIVNISFQMPDIYVRHHAVDAGLE